MPPYSSAPAAQFPPLHMQGQQPVYPSGRVPPYPPPPSHHQPQAGPPPTSVSALLQDISRLITATKGAFERDPYDAVVQGRLKALLDLQTVLQTQNLPQAQLEQVKLKVDELAGGAPHQQHQYAPPPPIRSPVVSPHKPQPAVSLDALLGKGALATLLAGGAGATPTPPLGLPMNQVGHVPSWPTPPPPMPNVLPSAIRSPVLAQRATTAGPAFPLG